MKRRVFEVSVSAAWDDMTTNYPLPETPTWTARKFSFNSAIRESEAMVRRWARENGTTCEGAKPVSEPGVAYTRFWYPDNYMDGDPDGHHIIWLYALIREVSE